MHPVLDRGGPRSQSNVFYNVYQIMVDGIN